MINTSQDGPPPHDKNGVVLKPGQMVVAHIVRDPPKVVIGGQKLFLGPKVRHIFGKLIIVGSPKSVIMPDSGIGLSEEVNNEDITVVVA